MQWVSHGDEAETAALNGSPMLRAELKERKREEFYFPARAGTRFADGCTGALERENDHSSS